MEYAPQANVAVLASGDGDFDMLVQKLIDKHQMEVEVYGVEKLTAASLVHAATRYVPITERLLMK